MKRFMWWHVYVLRHKVTSDITRERLVNMCWDCPAIWRYEPKSPHGTVPWT